MQGEMMCMVQSYSWPSQAFWRYFELQALRGVPFERPILEIGCGDGEFTSRLLEEIDEAIDINPRSVEKAKRAQPCIYRSVRCQDARQLHPDHEGYGTVYANCVMEHIPEVDSVLRACFQSLRHGGMLAITVPLMEMNEHLLLPWNWYARLRRGQLQHLNLLSIPEWRDKLTGLGFTGVQFRPYLYGPACRFWDSLDAFACIGSGRYNLSSAARILGRTLLSRSAKRAIQTTVTGWLERKRTINYGTDACAAAILAIKE
jgi:SAM-dependent methyltransferase